MIRAVGFLIAIVGVGLLAPSAHAVERCVRTYDERDGLTVAETTELAEDTRGFIWIGTIGGLTRFDGSEMRPWAPRQVRHDIQVLATGPDGEVIVAGTGEPLWRVTADSVEAIAGPGGGPIHDWVDAALCADGALWVASPDTLHRLGEDQRWQHWTLNVFDGSPLRRVIAARGESLFVATQAALWTISPAGPPRRIAEIPTVSRVVRLPDGSLIVSSWRPGRVWKLEASGPRLLYEESAGAPGLAVRGRTVWAAIGGHVVSIAPDGAVRVVAPVPGLPNGRPLLVDREGTLWIGGYRGLLALPEPETVSWNELDGLPTPAHAHHLCRTSDAVWVVTWVGTVRMDLTGKARTLTPMGLHSGRIRADGRDRLWAADLDRGFIRWDGARETRYARSGVHGVYGTSLRADGRLWLATDEGLFLTPSNEGAPMLVQSRPPTDWPTGWSDCWLGPTLEDREGRLWIGRESDLYWCNADSLARGLEVSWRHEPIRGGRLLLDLVELDDGRIWVATDNSGVQERGALGWTVLGGNSELGSLRVYGMAPAASGGVWVLTAGTLVRVIPRPDLPAGWEIVERLTSWQGLPTQQAGDIHEDPDGRLWLASLAGLVEVPAEARHFESKPPPVAWVDVRIDGRPVSIEQSVRLPWRRNRLEIRFAALSYRDRNRLRYEVRTRADQPWQEIEEPLFRFVDVAPGRYRAEVRASLDGQAWTDPPIALPFEVGRPWWQEPPALAGFAALIAAALVLAHRIRVAMLLRLERQRIRIAMELHDEVGSGLGSIGILAGLASDRELDDERRVALTSRIAETAGELGGALGDIVRALRHGSDTLESFAHRLAERARRLVPGESPRLLLNFPSRWPSEPLAPETQRQLQSLISEAIHNAARHAEAREIELGLGLADNGSSWRIWVRDDGCGLDAPSIRPGGGHGLENMRARARSIGGTIEIGPNGEVGSNGVRGTRVEVCFRLEPPPAHRTIMRPLGRGRNLR